MKKLLCILLVLMMLATLLLSCAEHKEKEPAVGGATTSPITTSAPESSTEPEDTASETTTEQTVPPEVPKTLLDELREKHLNEKKVITVIGKKVSGIDFEFDADASTPLTSVAYHRNEEAKKNLGLSNIVFKNINFGGNGGRVSTGYARRVTEMWQAGEDNFDILASFPATAVVLANKGFLVDLNDHSDYIDLSSPWYPKHMTEDFSITDSVYFVVGDITPSLATATSCIVINKELMQTKGISVEKYYKLAREGKWTLDELIMLVNNGYTDLDANNQKSDGDAYGLMSNVDDLYSFFVASDMLAFDNKDTSVGIKVSSDITSDKATSLHEKLSKLFESDHAYCSGSEKVYYEEKLFAEKANTIALVSDLAGTIYIRPYTLPNLMFEFGILPMPKYDLSQEDYQSPVTNLVNTWGVYANSSSDERISAVALIEEMGRVVNKVDSTAILYDRFMTEFDSGSDEMWIYRTILHTARFDHRVTASELLYEKGTDDIGSIERLWFETIRTSSKSWADVVKEYNSFAGYTDALAQFNQNYRDVAAGKLDPFKK